MKDAGYEVERGFGSDIRVLSDAPIEAVGVP